jgi:hypothetical protein
MAQVLLLCPWPTLVSGMNFVHHEYPWLTASSFAEKVLKAAAGEKGVVEPSYVYLPGVPGGDAIAKTVGVEFFSVPIELGVSDTL